MKKRSLWSRVLTILLVLCMLMTDQSTSLFVEAVSAAAQQQTEGEETLQQSSGENNQEIQEGGEETSQNTEIQEPTTEQEPEIQEGSQTETDGNEESADGTLKDAEKVYVQEGDSYKQLNGNKVYINPEGDSTSSNVSTAGKITIFVNPSTYVIQESGLPQYTQKVTGGQNNADDKEVIAVAEGEGQDIGEDKTLL